MLLIRLLLIATVAVWAFVVVLFAAALGDKWWIVPVAFLAYAVRPRRGGLWAFGTARFSDRRDLEGMIDAGQGFVLGHANVGKPPLGRAIRGLFSFRVRSADAVQAVFKAMPFTNSKSLVWLRSLPHVTVVFPTSVGKSQSIALPWIIANRDSAIITDPKGELFKLTEAQCRLLGDRVGVIDPYKITGGPSLFINPMSVLSPNSPTLIDDCKALAAAIVVPDKNAKDRFWEESSKDFISAAILGVVLNCNPPDRTLQTVRTVLADPAQLAAMIQFLCSFTGKDAAIVQRIGHSLTHHKEKQLASVLSSVNMHLNFLDTPTVFETTSSTTIEPVTIRHVPTKLFIVIQPDMMNVAAPLVRLIITVFARALLSSTARPCVVL